MPHVKTPAIPSERRRLVLLGSLAGLCVWHLLLLVTPRLYPFLDMPNHLGMAAMLKHYHSSANLFEEYFSLHLFPRPNIFHLLFCNLPFFSSVENANRFFWGLYAVGYAGACICLLRQLRASLWYVLPCLLLLYNVNVCYGLVGFAIAIPTLLFLLIMVMRYFTRPSIKNAAAISALLLLLFSMHALATLFAGMLLGLCAVAVHRTAPRRFAADLAIVLPVAVLLCWWWFSESHDYHGPGMVATLRAYYRDTYLSESLLRAALPVYDNFSLYAGWVGYLLAALFAAVTLCPLCWSLRRTHKPSQTALHLMVRLFAASCLACYVLMPSTLPGYSFLFQRFAPLCLLSAILYGASRLARRPPLWMRSLFLITCVLHAFLWTGFFKEFQLECRTFTTGILPRPTAETRMAALLYDPYFRGRPLYENFLDYYIVWQQGLATTRIIDDRSFPFRRRAIAGHLPRYLKWVSKGTPYRDTYRDVDYLLVRGAVPPQVQNQLRHFQPVARQGRWRLLRNTLPPDPRN